MFNKLNLSTGSSLATRTRTPPRRKFSRMCGKKVCTRTGQSAFLIIAVLAFPNYYPGPFRIHWCGADPLWISSGSGILEAS